jgi:acyl dehydratase
MDTAKINLIAGEKFEHTFSFSQNDVIKFAAVTGDTNPVHLDAAYAAGTPFKKPIMHGFLSGSIFSKVFGTIFPGEGTIYLMQQLVFKRPMYVDEHYVAVFTILDINPEKFILEIECKVVNSANAVCLEGNARLLNRRIFGQ